MLERDSSIWVCSLAPHLVYRNSSQWLWGRFSFCVRWRNEMWWSVIWKEKNELAVFGPMLSGFRFRVEKLFRLTVRELTFLLCMKLFTDVISIVSYVVYELEFHLHAFSTLQHHISLTPQPNIWSRCLYQQSIPWRYVIGFIIQRTGMLSCVKTRFFHPENLALNVPARCALIFLLILSSTLVLLGRWMVCIVGSVSDGNRATSRPFTHIFNDRELESLFP